MPGSSLSMAGTSEQLTGQQSQAGSQDRPERSRNAKAQARHRAKRKAYIEQLEQTVVRLQNALAASPDQVSSLPPPLMRIRELEQENIQLNREVEELRRQLEARNARLRPDIDHRHHGFAPYDDRHFDREAKRRRPMINQDEPFLIANTQLPSPPLSTASSLTPYSHTTSATMSQQRSPTATTPMTSYSMPYPMPETPSSSTASSPSTTSFSPTEQFASFARGHGDSQVSQSHVNSQNYSNACGYGGVVKVEEESYADVHQLPQSNGYSSSLSAYGTGQTPLSQWHTYPERA